MEGLCGIVTGGSRGIGRHLALALAREGAKCVINYVKEAEAAAATVAEIHALGGTALAVRADVSNPKAAHDLVAQATAAWGRIDFVINNAGITRDAFIEKMTLDEWNSVIDTNLNGCFYMLKASLAGLTTSKGSLINIISRAAFTGFFGNANYAASKAGLIALTKTAARELGKYGIRVNAISPPFIADGLPAAHPKREMLEKRAAEDSLLGRKGVPKDLNDFVLYLLGDAGRQVTGQVFKIDSRPC